MNQQPDTNGGTVYKTEMRVLFYLSYTNPSEVV